MESSKSSQLQGAKRVLRYVKGTIHYGQVILHYRSWSLLVIVIVIGVQVRLIDR